MGGELFPFVGAQARRRRALHDLLVAPLHGAVPLEEVHHVAVGVPQYLNLQVTRPPDETLEEDAVLAERHPCLPTRGQAGIGKLVRIGDPPHAPAATAPTGLDDSGKADPGCQFQGRLDIVGEHVGGGNGGHARAGGGFPCGYLVAEQPQGVGTRPDEGDTRRGAGFGELRRLGQEAVAGMDGVAAGFAGDPYDLVDTEVGGDRPEPLADAVGFVGFRAMQREAVLFREHGDRRLVHLVRGTQYADGDLAAIGDQYPGESAHRPRFPFPQ